jgi:hypothetical protein
MSYLTQQGISEKMTVNSFNSSQLIVYLLSILVCISLVSTLIPGIQYIKYIIPFIAIFTYFIGEKKHYIHRPNNLNIALFFYLLWGLIGLVIPNNFNLVDGSKDLFFIAAYLIPVCLYIDKDLNINNIFYLFSVFFLISTLGMQASTFSLADSTAPFEGSECFVFGMFALYFLMERKYRLLIIAIFFVLLTLKRIALLAFILCLLVWLAPIILQKKVLNRAFFLLINSIFVTLIILLGVGWADELIFEVTGKSVNYFTLGRFNIYMGVVDDIITYPLNLILGNGAGSSYPLTVLNTTDLLDFNSLHSDSLKILYEHGVIFFIMFFWISAKLKNLKSKIVLLYICILFITDNVLIYVSVMFFTLTIINVYESNAPKDKAVGKVCEHL